MKILYFTFNSIYTKIFSNKMFEWYCNVNQPKSTKWNCPWKSNCPIAFALIICTSLHKLHLRCLKSQSFISLDNSFYSNLVDSRITTNFHTYIIISHLYNHYNVFIKTDRTVNRHWYSDTNIYLWAYENAYLWAYVKVSEEKLSCWEWLNFYYWYSVYNNQRRYRRRPAMTDRQLMATNRWWLFGVHSCRPLAISRLIPRQTE